MCRAMQENFDEGYAEGFAEGYAEGFAESYAEGFAESFAEGREKAAANLLRKGWLSFDEIADVSDLPIERVMELKGELETEERQRRNPRQWPS